MKMYCSWPDPSQTPDQRTELLISGRPDQILSRRYGTLSDESGIPLVLDAEGRIVHPSVHAIICHPPEGESFFTLDASALICSAREEAGYQIERNGLYEYEAIPQGPDCRLEQLLRHQHTPGYLSDMPSEWLRSIVRNNPQVEAAVDIAEAELLRRERTQ